MLWFVTLQPLPETVTLVEDIVVEYITDMASLWFKLPVCVTFYFSACYTMVYGSSNTLHWWFPQVHKAQDTAFKRGKLLTEDFLFLIRKVQFLHWTPDHKFNLHHSQPLALIFTYINGKTLLNFLSGNCGIKKDLPKLNRCTELLSMNEELKQARKAFEVDEEKLASADWGTSLLSFPSLITWGASGL